MSVWESTVLCSCRDYSGKKIITWDLFHHSWAPSILFFFFFWGQEIKRRKWRTKSKIKECFTVWGKNQKRKRKSCSNVLHKSCLREFKRALFPHKTCFKSLNISPTIMQKLSQKLSQQNKIVEACHTVHWYKASELLIPVQNWSSWIYLFPLPSTERKPWHIPHFYEK